MRKIDLLYNRYREERTQRGTCWYVHPRVYTELLQEASFGGDVQRAMGVPGGMSEDDRTLFGVPIVITEEVNDWLLVPLPNTAHKREAELEDALVQMYKAWEELLPGVSHIPLQDYAIQNDAPVQARKVMSTKAWRKIAQ